jgi:hypothetical protein
MTANSVGQLKARNPRVSFVDIQSLCSVVAGDPEITTVTSVFRTSSAALSNSQ